MRTGFTTGFILKEVSFSCVPEGWIFTVRGRRSHLVNRSYLVNEAQKAELLARINRWRVVGFILLTSILAALVAAAASLSRSGFSHWIALAMVAAIVGSPAFYLYRAAIPYIQWLLLRPVLAGAPAPSGFWDSLLVDLKSESRDYSTGWLVLFCLVLGGQGVKSVYDALTSNGDYITAIFFSFYAVQFGVVLFLKLRAKQSSEQPGVDVAGEHNTKRDRP